MNKNLPSKTCLYVAAGRALGAREPDVSIRNPDYLAERLLGPEERALIAEQAVVQALDRDFAEARKNTEAFSAAVMMIIRTRFIEERLEQAIRDGVSQLVILGAGFDTRAYRLVELLKAARVFEVDQSSTQEYKKRRVREAGIEVPPNLTYVAIDFRHDKLGDVLAAAGYDSSQKTFFIWEGVTMYLPEAAVEETLRWVAAQAPGSTIIFDFVGAVLIQFMATADLSKLPEAVQKAFERFRGLTSGEPWIFGLPDTKEREFLAKVGLELHALLPIGGEESMKRFLTRSDGTPYIPVPPPQQQAPVQRAGYCLAEAVVPAR
ncbi:MAG: SAM-dependent methyltransferase [Acidobacteriia bacterium]|nr:SAM-dependent methyltransferase [Terriglobia bacterium]